MEYDKTSPIHEPITEEDLKNMIIPGEESVDIVLEDKLDDIEIEGISNLEINKGFFKKHKGKLILLPIIGIVLAALLSISKNENTTIDCAYYDTVDDTVFNASNNVYSYLNDSYLDEKPKKNIH